MKVKRKAEVDRGHCVACGACVQTCPIKAIEIYKGCYATVDSLRCIGCGKCSKVCPASVITLTEVGA